MKHIAEKSTDFPRLYCSRIFDKIFNRYAIVVYKVIFPLSLEFNKALKKSLVTAIIWNAIIVGWRYQTTTFGERIRARKTRPISSREQPNTKEEAISLMKNL